jgi:hypothetical protein
VYQVFSNYSSLYPFWAAYPSGSTVQTQDFLAQPSTGDFYFEYSGTPASMGGGFHIRNKPGDATANVWGVDKDGLEYHQKTYTVTGLPSCASGTQDAQTMVTDATAFTVGSAPTGGGTYRVPVYCQNHNGSFAWIMR